LVEEQNTIFHLIYPTSVVLIFVEVILQKLYFLLDVVF